ncbi:pyridoxine biosynthesis protein PDX2, putative [Plasmodium berghei]|uniref:Pyridoxal 5'-phosphate synthase subunit Pdx2 n=3 Tax=Plasmodium berghei TaxID=5821 RepID=PDX2_PLABE|nr:pyridoxine biosynthesis protein PDX2, putative [Plasmodium berghei ANKA]Q4PJX5.1 RecName: Full=Pyridoxal 5'-phosphate synthase subunit Pdx2; AltName: Full=Pyridoxal 5'-phosphate synthase glutaminase subunit [Plasmodium berghei]AAY83290.1 pyridoxine biosynthesis protein 2 [Plasmodium berghei]CXI44717.1 pyridoxine biosynthesis protein PDX2, putative [Plasmodium berghei]SCM22546.1 pyridoxine biosynthesis protein PDX2, putative [Plasmodium berghei]SCN25517.1 pyridoxine biosynthesis protein PDX2|eukprot:XP_034421668.1 pyridoxine biosynthesis protein PDX2, putative [Plasmodium berghei ANKA]
MEKLTIGVLSLQGNFQSHINHFLQLQNPSLKVIEVRNKTNLRECDGIVIPGGESTTLRKCMSYDNDSLYNALKNYIHVKKKPVWGTCAGCILLSEKVEKNKDDNIENEYGNDFSLGGLDIEITRNYYGSQNDSFICSLDIKSQDPIFKKNIRAPCIRAPFIKKISSDKVVTIATFSHESFGKNIIGAVEQDNCMGTIFHPELMPYTCFHDYFLEKVKKHIKDSREA